MTAEGAVPVCQARRV
ncbi:hypothetical protein STRIP9103_05911, partial [Streptomyces ipomoeae 91-03]